VAGTDEGSVGRGVGVGSGADALPGALGLLESSVLSACDTEAEWPAQIAAGVAAGVDFVVANPALATVWVEETAGQGSYRGRYEQLVARLCELIRLRAPGDSRLPLATDEARVAGMVGLVGDHIRIGRIDRLVALKPELVLVALLPYLGFEEAREWANRFVKEGGCD
jgi:hypothetical protein